MPESGIEWVTVRMMSVVGMHYVLPTKCKFLTNNEQAVLWTYVVVLKM
jgi:hypothetical protein